MQKKIRKIIVTIGLLIFFGFGFKLAKAASTLENYHKSTEKGKITREQLDKHTFADTIFSSFEAITGRINPETGEIEEEGAIQFGTKLIAALYSAPPASGVYYAYDVLQRLGATPAYAQGVGFTGLQPILPIWKAFRNVTYILFSIIFIAMGVAIMFRIKISPQAVITIENALPKVISALILVTFSYAIAGFMIDLMYVVMSLIITILKPLIPQSIISALVTGAATNPANISPQGIINSGFFSLIPPFATMVGESQVLSLFIGGILGSLAGGAMGTVIPIPILGSVIGAIAGGVIGATVGATLIGLIFGIIALFCLIKLFISLIKGYIKIVLAIILAPFQIALGAIPIGIKGQGFGSWLKNVITELSVFPAVLAVALIGVIIGLSALDNNQNMWIAPLIGPPNIGPSIGLTGAIIKTVISLGFLLMLSNLPDMIRKAMGQTQTLGTAIGQALGPGIAVATWPFRKTWSDYSAAKSKFAQDQMIAAWHAGGGVRETLPAYVKGLLGKPWDSRESKKSAKKKKPPKG